MTRKISLFCLSVNNCKAWREISLKSVTKPLEEERRKGLNCSKDETNERFSFSVKKLWCRVDGEVKQEFGIKEVGKSQIASAKG